MTQSHDFVCRPSRRVDGSLVSHYQEPGHEATSFVVKLPREAVRSRLRSCSHGQFPFHHQNNCPQCVLFMTLMHLLLIDDCLFALLGLTLVFSIIVLGLAADVTSFTEYIDDSYFQFAALTIATAVLTLVSLPVL
jgi:hypothetical protein